MILVLSSLAIWRYKEIIEALIQFVKAVAESETTRGVFNTRESLNGSVTKQIVNYIASILPALTMAVTEASLAADTRLYCKWIIDLSTSIVNIVDNWEIRDNVYQIMVNGLGGEYPSMIVLPCIVKLSLIEGDDRVKEVNSLLTSLLMNYRLANVIDSIGFLL